ncbi:carboxylate-amine ligase [Wenzhouxiangella marina]|uniref:Glutamate--cysteine ligase GCS2 n=1 Tax=Wenzhouxiangella marina TaxID=1579979 RepID=A0A0K0XW01_9GAMM|nr:glutamate-cysteine ligase family protein [Wenzhouxiangella marina]AKS41884.1 Glutamate--cysteine ligase GCS2 [Wenzhouxiangella marina]MBB6086350.1 gamma-glutamyl:cysteine ligase YbdK (ATP-grasp superfamily) [Wenzhouxiangella marina]
MPTLSTPDQIVHLHAFAGYGIELEYMIVDRETLSVRPLAETLLVDADGQVVNEVDHGALAWSNELVAHVVELKTNGPAPTLVGLAERFHGDLIRINERLAEEGAQLLPTAMHPLFDPSRETRLWPYGQTEIYQTYDRIFGCRGHGWSNLQSMHINLPFADDEEFRRLHAAIRVVLPLIPALAASSPYEEGRASAWLDGRLRYYRDNQRRVPSISGPVVPEPVGGIADYHQRILKPMYQAIAPLDPDEVLRDDWLNSRGAIARFERQTIEIRTIDLQECPRADLAIAEVVTALVRAFYEERLASFEAQQATPTGVLAALMWQAAAQGSATALGAASLQRLYGIDHSGSLQSVWLELLSRLDGLSETAARTIEMLLVRGPLAAALRTRLGEAPERAAIVETYQELARCLRDQRLFMP